MRTPHKTSSYSRVSPTKPQNPIHDWADFVYQDQQVRPSETYKEMSAGTGIRDGYNNDLQYWELVRCIDVNININNLFSSIIPQKSHNGVEDKQDQE
jgi:hypothetical protein